MASDTATAPPREEIDRKQLRTVRSRFRAIGEARLARVRAMLNDRQRQFLDLLPLLFHTNHAALPGYVSAQTPCGIPDYRPGTEVNAVATRTWRSYEPRTGTGAPPGEGVLALYLMGSLGTLGHSDASDLDVWICYPDALDEESLELLQRKTDLLSAWGRELGVESHLFLMNGEKFRRGQREPLTGENCGSAQHYLLLDEFYRTGILLAGRHPAWWLVPPAREPQFADYLGALTTQRQVKATDIVDFGGIHAVPAGEFVGAGIWQLYKAIDSPYKSVLKLLLFEIYADQFPAAECLSAGFKRAVYAGLGDIDELDPYLMIYRRLEEHLVQREQPERLELVRRCLYYKAGIRLSQPRGARPAWQRLLMERLAADWGWDRRKLALLDSRSSWSITEVASERNALVKELVCSYRFLADLARRVEVASSIDARELSILGRKLHAAYERRAGKIENLNVGSAPGVTEPELAICASGSLWGAWASLVSARGLPEGRALRQAACLSELLGWCVVNGVIGERTRLSMREAADGLRPAEVEPMLREIRELAARARQALAAGDEAFATQARPLAVVVFVNVAADPLAPARQSGLQRISSRTDSLGYSAMRENLVLNLETVVCNSWGELVAMRYDGEDGLLRCLRELLQLFPAGDGPRPELRVRCFCASRASSIEARMGELFQDLVHGLRDGAGAGHGRYVFAVQKRLHLLREQDGRAETLTADSPDELLGLLGAPRARWGPLAIDRYALQDTVLPLVAPLLESGGVSVFCERQSEGLRLLAADECGALLAWQAAGSREASVLAALGQFLQSVRLRQESDPRAMAQAPAPARFFLVARTPRGGYAAQRLQLPAAPGAASMLVQAIAEPLGGEAVGYTVYCEGTAFSQRELGEGFAAALAAHIRSLRHGDGDYPVYITDLDLSALEAGGSRPVGTVEYLRHRLTLEQALNAQGNG